jgi:hypothetical protein
MTAKSPTPQGISRLLAKAGFERHRRYSSADGFTVMGGHPGLVHVWHFGTDRDTHLSAYGDAIRTAGFHVATHQEPGYGPQLIISVRKDTR